MRLLIASLDNLGDLVFASALVPPLRRAFPDARITLWCKAYAQAVAPLVPGLSDWEAADPFWDRSPGTPRGALVPFIRAAWRLRRERYDVAIVTSGSWKVAAAARFAGIPRRIGLDGGRNGRWLTDLLPAMEPDRPVVAQLLQLLAPLGIRGAASVYRLDPAPLRMHAARMRDQVGDVPLVAMHPFAGADDRRMPLAEWEAVARAVERRGFVPLWLGSRGELEALRAAHPRLARHHFADQLGDGSLRDAIAAVVASEAFIGHDSGPLHVAAALAVPCIGVFAPGEPRRTFPQGPGPARVVAGASPQSVHAPEVIAALDALGIAPR